MPAPAVPTDNNLDERRLLYHSLEQLEYWANLIGDSPAPTIPNINNFDPRNLGYEFIRQLRDINVRIEEGNLVRYKNTLLTAVQVKGLLAANIEVVPAPVAGFANIPISVHMLLFHAGTNDFIQTAGTDMLALLYNGGAEITELGSAAQLTTLLEASASAALFIKFGAPFGATPLGMVPVAAAALDLDNNGAAEITGNAGNDNTLSLRVGYETVPMVAFG